MNSQQFIETVLQANDVTSHYQFIDRTANEHPSTLLPVFELLSTHHEKFETTWQLRAVYERILDAVCLSEGIDQISVAFALSELVISEQDKRRIAAYLASRQLMHDLCSQILQKGNAMDSYLAELIAHELVCRGHDLRSHLKFYEFASEASSKTQFKYLPLFPLTIETGLSLGTVNIGSSSNSISFGLHNNPFERLDPKSRVIRDFKENKHISLPVHHWSEQSNGSTIGIKGSAEVEINAKSLLEQLDFADLFADNYKLKPLTADQTFQILFNACANGGAYTRGQYGAVARLYSWRAIHAMTSDEELIDAQATEHKALEYTWSEFVVDNWFINEWLDLGIIGIGPNRKDFSILAATDTD